MNIKTLLSWAVTKLDKAQIKNPHLEAELLLSNATKKSRENILSHSDEKVNILQIAIYKLQIHRRIRGFPLAYLTKSKNFYSYEFFVNKHVLIPRPETEMMVEEALSCITHHITHNKKILCIDIGTGSGCIPITLAKELMKLKAKSYQLEAIDISKKALKIAEYNAKKHKVNNEINFHRGNLLEPIFEDIMSFTLHASRFTITANLPYLTPEQVQNSPTIQNEPKIALQAGIDGLFYYRELLGQVKALNQITNYKLPITLYLEIDPCQEKSISKLIKTELGQVDFQIKKDLNGLQRLVKLDISNTQLRNQVE